MTNMLENLESSLIGKLDTIEHVDIFTPDDIMQEVFQIKRSYPDKQVIIYVGKDAWGNLIGNIAFHAIMEFNQDEKTLNQGLMGSIFGTPIHVNLNVSALPIPNVISVVVLNENTEEILDAKLWAIPSWRKESELTVGVSTTKKGWSEWFPRVKEVIKHQLDRLEKVGLVVSTTNLDGLTPGANYLPFVNESTDKAIFQVLGRLSIVVLDDDSEGKAWRITTAKGGDDLTKITTIIDYCSGVENFYFSIDWESATLTINGLR